ncbi:decaprenyl-phosphate phosphoribosyltransferase [uncultured Thermanaerothrix sp.]|uniref:decaprenyl-phosphate phosphoribosyltransferase n=1 Tax=uncultured Thermanaerothrix sp. TaxID=1195149 RepID=UPI00261D0F27|nr:decaprenyl-phosphate phosphoribosyltransferase [uncultured Thermanaerothrix sp.]
MGMIRALIKTMRPRQWTKNAFVLAALVFDRQLTHIPAALRTLLGFVLFCLISGVVYIFNDIMDAEADRHHPQKRLRPIASGALPVPVAQGTAIALVLLIFPIAFYLSTAFGLILSAYFFINLVYSRWLKHIPILDVLIIAAGFVLRVAGGVSLIQVERFSPWLYVVTTLLALYIGFGKRRAELSELAEQANTHRRVLDGYTIPFLDHSITIVSSSTIIAYSLYTFSAPNLPSNHLMMLTIPFVLYGILRYLYLVQVEGSGGSPEDLLLTDRPLQVTILLWGIAVLVIFYAFPIK